MTRETQVGLVVASSFLCLLGTVLTLKMNEEPQPGPAAIPAPAAIPPAAAEAGPPTAFTLPPVQAAPNFPGAAVAAGPPPPPTFPTAPVTPTAAAPPVPQ